MMRMRLAMFAMIGVLLPTTCTILMNMLSKALAQSLALAMFEPLARMRRANEKEKEKARQYQTPAAMTDEAFQD